MFPYNIGTYVDQSVIPGFHYIVRPTLSKTPLFGGKPKKLLSIGRGYGKRFTFDSSDKNENNNYFWSDSYPDGFGFAPHEVFPGHSFRILAGEQEMGIAIVKKANKPQREIEMSLLPGGGVLKRFRVEVLCSMEMGEKVITRACTVVGTAIVVKTGPKDGAVLQRIEAPGLDTELYKSFRDVPGELTFIASSHQKYLKED